MKQFSLLLILIVFRLTAFSQAAVTVPALEKMAAKEAIERKSEYAKTAKTLKEAYKQTEELSKSTKFLKENADRLSKINKYILNLDRLSTAINNQKRSIEKSRQLINDLQESDLFTPNEYSRMNRQILDMVANSNRIIKMLDIVLGPKSKMSDSERMQALELYEKQLRERQSLMNANIRQYTSIRNRRSLQKAQEKINKSKR